MLSPFLNSIQNKLACRNAVNNDLTQTVFWYCYFLKWGYVLTTDGYCLNNTGKIICVDVDHTRFWFQLLLTLIYYLRVSQKEETNKLASREILMVRYYFISSSIEGTDQLPCNSCMVRIYSLGKVGEYKYEWRNLGRDLRRKYCRQWKISCWVCCWTYWFTSFEYISRSFRISLKSMAKLRKFTVNLLRN